MLFNKTSQEVDKGPLGQDMSESERQRVLRYSTFWQFYLGRQWAWKREEGEPQMTFNYSRAFVDKGIAFLFGKGFGWDIANETQRAIIAPILKEIWEDNQKALWGIECGQMGSVSGDVFIKVGREEPNKWNGLEESRVRMIILDSGHCFPEWHPHAKDVMVSFRLSYSYERAGVRGEKARVKYTEIITKDRFIIIDGDVRYEWPNSLGFIPIVHIKNIPIANATYGLSDLNDFTGLNREYNEKATSISDIINYHQAPVTVVYGAKATSLEKGANKLWSGLPKDARVENLQLQSDLRASVDYMELLKKNMHELTNVPEATLGQMQAVSNTSGVALHVQYQPLLEQRAKKILTYGTGLEKVNRMALKIWEITNSRDFKAEMPDVKDPYKTATTFPDPLPKDRLVLLQEIQQRMSMPYPLITPPQALALLGEEDVDKMLADIDKWIEHMKPAEVDAEGKPIKRPKPPQGAEEVNPDKGNVDARGKKIATNAGGIMHKSMSPQGATQTEIKSVYNPNPL